MAYNCVDVVLEQLKKEGSKVTKAEVEAIVGKMTTEKQLVFTHGILNPDSAYRKKAMETVGRFRQAMATERLRAQDSLRARHKIVERAGAYATPAEGLEAIMVGIQKRIEAGRDSISARQAALEGKLTAELEYLVETAGLKEIAGSGSLDLEARMELSELNKGVNGKPGITKNKEAAELAKVFFRSQKLALGTLNGSGAYIRELSGYAGKITHDAGKLGKVGKEAWIDSILPLLDDERTFRSGFIDEDPVAFLGQVYDDIQAGTSSRNKVDAGGDQLYRIIDSPANIARKAERSRVLHFKDAASEHAYLQSFGEYGNMFEEHAAMLRKAGKDAALMQVLGPNPEATFQVLLKHYDKAITPLQKDNLQIWMKELQGHTLRPGESMMAQAGTWIRLGQTFSKLGMAMPNSIGDLATRALQLSNSLGTNAVEAQFKSFSTFVSTISNPEQRRMITYLTGVASDAYQGEILRQIGEGGNRGAASKMARLFYKLNLQAPWTAINKQAQAAIHAAELGFRAPTKFDALDVPFQNNLKRYGIGKSEWDMIRSVVKKAQDGRDYVGFSDVFDIPLKDAEAHARAAGIIPDGVSDRRAQQLAERYRTETATKLSTYYNDQSSTEAMLDPTAKERGYLLRGSHADTYTGQALRLWAQFKMFPTSMLTQVTSGTMYAKGATDIKGAFVGPNSNKAGIGQLVASLGMYAYVGMAVNDLVNNKTPRSLNDKDTWIEMLKKGGAGGLYADYLMGDFDRRHGRGFLSSFAGPTFGQLDDVASLVTDSKKYLLGDKKTFPKTAATRLAMNNTPLMNHFVTRSALSYSVLYNWNEQMNPGYIKRMEKRMKNQGQEFMVKP